jgi:CheY-like chemotaxis protein
MPATLFLADDNVTIQRVIELTFADEDVRVLAATDGEAALRRIEAEPPDVVLADVGMPKLDGYELSTRIKNTPALKQIPVLLLTGAFEPIDQERAKASGCDGILVKPLEPHQLIDRVKELLAARRTPTLAAPPPPPAPPPLRIIPPPQPFVMREPEPKLELKPEPKLELKPEPKLVATPEPRLEPKPAPKPVPEPPKEPAEVDFQREFDQLDAAFADLDPEPITTLDDQTASEFARDLDLFREGSDAPAAQQGDAQFGGWDIPAKPAPDAPPPPPVAAATGSPWDLSDALPAPDDQPAAVANAPQPAPLTAHAETPGETVSLAGAFAALLAAEQTQPASARSRAQPGAALSEEAVEEVVRRVLVRLTDETVQQIVLQTAERLIKEEIQKIRSTT